MSMIIPNVEELVEEDHLYRKLLKVVDWTEVTCTLRNLYSAKGRAGYAVEQGFRCLVLQFLEDLSDRQMERFLKYDVSAKYFTGFGLTEQTPDHAYFGQLRKRIGTVRLADLFSRVSEALIQQGLIRQVFTFIDASAIHARVNVWEARDKALADRENQEKNDDGDPTMNNNNVGGYSSDPEARFGCKGKDKIWFGYKRHLAVDMSHGLIGKAEVTPANVADAKGLPLVCPEQGMVFGDKGYCSRETREEITSRGCHPGVILKNNMKAKNRDRDRWLSSLRAPFEGVFSVLGNRSRYRGLAKNQFQNLMQALAFNLRRLCVIAAPPIELYPI